VAYPIVLLGEEARDLHRYLRNLDEAMIRTLARDGLASGRVESKTGVGLGERKIVSIGIAYPTR
jgi:lipoyl(octanoyl) transferase